jgi:predicted ATP-dependent protease
VIIPVANVRHLMLSEEVVAAVRAGQFHVWAAGSIEEGIEVLTCRPAGQRNQEGEYPEGTVHRLVEDRLRDYADTAQAFGAGPAGQEGRSREQHPAG